MPRHDFLCRASKKEFSKILTPWECDEGRVSALQRQERRAAMGSLLGGDIEVELVRFESLRSHQCSRNTGQGREEAGRGILPGCFSLG